MKSLECILFGVDVLDIRGDLQTSVSGLTPDSRTVTAGCLFVALRGAAADGNRFVGAAIEAGAVAIVSEEAPSATGYAGVVWVQVKDARAAMARMAAHFYDHPSSGLRLVGVTGTNGKTSVATILYDIFSRLGFACGLISTVRLIWPGYQESARLTTPDVVTLQGTLRRMADAGCAYVFMEVSSHAAHQGRIDGLHFQGAIFTNLTHDHLDYHGTFAAYLAAKKSFFDGLQKDAFALVNVDDRNGRVMVQNTKARVVTYGLKHLVDYKGRILENRMEGLLMRMGDQVVSCQLSGEFNAYNLLAAYGAACELGADPMAVLEAISAVPPVEGRMEIVRGNQGATGVIDFAHTPDALEKVLRSVSPLRASGRKLLLVVGCGGDRDKAKRPKMGAIASRLADVAVFTSDNPRSERPEAILEDMLSGVDEAFRQRVQLVTSREQAIQVAARLAQAGDILVVAGKGHEKYQEIAGEKKPFDDKRVLEAAWS